MVVPTDEPESTGPNQWAVAAGSTVAESDWTYHARKALNDGKGDAVITALDYRPVCNHMPVCKEKCGAPTWMYLKKGLHSHH